MGSAGKHLSKAVPVIYTGIQAVHRYITDTKQSYITFQGLVGWLAS